PISTVTPSTAIRRSPSTFCILMGRNRLAEPNSENSGQLARLRDRSKLCERSAQLAREQLRLLPGSEVAAPFDPVVVGQGWVGIDDPTARCGEDFAGKAGEGDRD